MSSLNTMSGRNGKFAFDDTLIARTTQWSVSPTLATSSDWGDSDSAGYTNRLAGRRDCTFSAEGKYDIVSEVFDLFAEGDAAAATLFLNGSTSKLHYHFPSALCSAFNMTVNVDTEEVIGWSADWGADGIFYRPGQGDNVPLPS